MRRSLGACALIMLLGAAVSPALAQYEEDKPSKLSVSIGVFRPSGSALRNDGSSTWKALSVGYNLRMNEMGRPDTRITIERTADRESRFDGNLTAISCVKLWHKKDPEPRGPYFGMGAGVYLLKAEKAPDLFLLGGEEHSGTKFGFSLIGGYNFNGNWFAELRYNSVSKLAPGVDFSGLTLYVGVGQLF